MGTPAFSVYSATKAAIRNFARSWALDLKGTGIRVNVLSPGATTTPGLLNGLARTGMQEALLAGLASQAPLERVGNPDETAAVALFLASDDSSFMTGKRSIRRWRSGAGLIQCERGCAMGSPLEIANQQRRLPMISFINDPKELKGKRTLLTGGSRGIGGAIVIERPNFGYGMKEVVGSIPISSTNQAAAESSEENRS
jgi:hypothetical protein